jgi:hypothetical protein
MVGRIVQGVIQECCECEVADEPVVVSKARPMKASNGVEGKTKPTISIVFDGVNNDQKL